MASQLSPTLGTRDASAILEIGRGLSTSASDCNGYRLGGPDIGEYTQGVALHPLASDVLNVCRAP